LVAYPKGWALVAWMLAAISVVTGLSWWDETREDDAALSDLEAEQSVFASSMAAGLKQGLATVQRDAILIGEYGIVPPGAHYLPVVVRRADEPRATTHDPERMVLTTPISAGRFVDLGLKLTDFADFGADAEHRRDFVVLVDDPDPNGPSLFGAEGLASRSPVVTSALRAGVRSLRLTPDQAVQLGLPRRTSVAGIATLDAGPVGRWGVVTAASAAPQRDRSRRAQRRLVLTVCLASGLVIAFGGAALRKQRREMELAAELSLSELRRQRDEDLLRAGRVATMGTFAMGIAHEVSTPLGIIVGRAEQLQGRLQGDERAAKHAQAILKQTERIQLIVRRFLDMARGRPPALVRTDPGAIARDATAAVEHRFARAQVSLSTDVPAALPLIQCDRDLLEQALVNLLLNACEACRAGGQVELAASADSERVVFLVNDDGAGIRPEDAARATEPFFTTKGNSQGSGLGLAIASEIVKSHHGALTIAPGEGKGTRARIEIPFVSGGRDAA
jgi:signal transduction histidine kinase